MIAVISDKKEIKKQIQSQLKEKVATFSSVDLLREKELKFSNLILVIDGEKETIEKIKKFADEHKNIEIFILTNQKEHPLRDIKNVYIYSNVQELMYHIKAYRNVIEDNQLKGRNLILIGGSAGSLKPIEEIFFNVNGNIPPVVIAIHMPEKFTFKFSKALDERSKVKVLEAKDKEILKDNHVYIAPGGKNIYIHRYRDEYKIFLKPPDPEEKLIPRIDEFFKSAIFFADKVVAILLSGMGKDGSQGLKLLKERNALTIVQTRKEALVYGIPFNALKLGVVDKIMSPKEIGILIGRIKKVNG